MLMLPKIGYMYGRERGPADTGSQLSVLGPSRRHGSVVIHCPITITSWQPRRQEAGWTARIYDDAAVWL